MDALRKVLTSAVNSNNDEEAGILSGLDDATSLSWYGRIKFFLLFYLLGFLMSFIGSITLFIYGLSCGGHSFALLYTLGNICSISSMMFLVGPLKQMKSITAPTRLIASIIVLASFIMTMVAAFVVESAWFALIMVIIQNLAMTWYSISYIPFARDAIIKMCSCFC